MIGIRVASSFVIRRFKVPEFSLIRGFSDYRRSDSSRKSMRPPAKHDFRRGSTKSDRRYDGGSSRDRDRGSRLQYGSWEEKPEPVYGRYDGDHLYGINSVRLALLAGRRNISELLVQDGMNIANKKDARAASEILDLASELGVPMREFSKHDLNMITENKPHQGFVLRAKPLEFTKMTHLERSDAFR